MAATFVSQLTFADSNQVKDFGFGLTHDEMVAQGYKSVVKSSGNEIYEKKTKSEFKKIVSLKNDYVSTVYRNKTGVYLQYTKLDEKGDVLGMAECKFQVENKTTACDVQTSEICQELIEKVDSGSYGFDLKKIEECADLSAKISYNRKSADDFMPEVEKKLGAVFPGIQSGIKKSPAVSLQTLLKDYAACKKAEKHLAKPTEARAAKAPTTKEDQGSH
ncbi:Hypothetical protein Bdt_0244 [Bdellovibrio bacteriovorus str. Tiberius]|uniref:Uncharacterized protein n=2 Tax=Bdellovibrio bacteriovorus TaxID=959 RepID=K7YQZ6_BDEBC|nr:Hypothetical protein Bdt_0244 [Bdellovibrio bacteriovorus str. Tiberius]